MSPGLRRDQDAQGQAIYDQLHGGTASEVIERDDGLLNAAPPGVYGQPFKAWQPQQREALRYVRGRVLDLGCGAGRHALELQRRGFYVLGIDNSPLAIRAARERGLQRSRVMSVTQVGRRLGTFDTLVMLGSNFGLLANAGRARWLLRRFRGMTSAEARIVAESRDPYDTTERVHRAYHARNRRRGRLGGQIRMRVRYRELATPWFDYLFVSQREMAQILAGTGWRIERTLESGGPNYVAVIGRE